MAVKEDNYGSQRILDGNWDAADEFAREFGLRFGPYVRWYVEGETEYGAVCRLRSLLNAHDVAVVNLHGIIKGKGFATALRAALKADRESRTFSFISIDGDVPDNVKVLRIAAREDKLCGAFFISTPNFECYNFTKDELEAILWQFAFASDVASSTDAEVYQAAVRNWDYRRGDIEDMFRRAENVLSLQRGTLHKGETWGQYLMDYAWEHPRQSKGTLRDILQSMRLLHIARTTNYHTTRRDYRVDPNTGNMVERDAQLHAGLESQRGE